MTNSIDHAFQVGTEVLVFNSRNNTVKTGTVIKNLKSVFKVSVSETEVIKFRHDSFGFKDNPKSHDCSENSYHLKETRVYASDAEEYLNGLIKSDKLRKEEKRQEQENRKAASDKLRADELAEAQEIIGGTDGLIMATRMADTMPDGSHYRVVDVPMKNNGGVRRVTVRVWTSENNLWGGEETKMCYTYQDFDKPGSFCSCSEQTVDSVESGIWEAIRSAHHAW
jgi:hypothetical protein